jgi:predicted porin
MKKSLLALAVFGAFAGAASAQSSVTMYGRVDLSIGKNAGSNAKFMANGSGSRLGMRGVEDLGGGMKALFNIETRFDADTGAAQNFNVAVPGSTTANGNRFWGARSIVGLEGGFGQVVLGREYTTAFLMSQLAADPWGWDTVAASTGTVAITGGGLARVRNDSSITYKIAASGFSFGAQLAEATDALSAFDKKPFNFAVTYAGGPISAGFGHEEYDLTTRNKTTWNTFNFAYNLGAVKLGALLGSGNSGTIGATATGKHKSYLLTATAPLGAGEFRAAYGKLKSSVATVGDVNKTFALGYHYSLSKRTTLYTDIASNSKAATSKSAYDVGLKHNF